MTEKALYAVCNACKMLHASQCESLLLMFLKKYQSSLLRFQNRPLKSRALQNDKFPKSVVFPACLTGFAKDIFGRNPFP